MKRAAGVCLFGLAICSVVTAAERPISIEAASKEVSRYQRLELTIRAEAAGDNPYDPANIDLAVEFTSPGGKKLSVPAFFGQPYERRQVERSGRKAEWLYPTGMPGWKARFAPTEVGAWSCEAVLKDRVGTARSAAVAFQCTASADKGFVRVSVRNPHYLERDDGSPFFAVGQNVAFITDSYLGAEMIGRLGAAGGNFARVWACAEDWAMAIEARKSAWGRSWAWATPIVLAPDRESYHTGRLCLKLAGDAGAGATIAPCHPVALRPETKYRFAGRIRADDGVDVSVDLGGPQTMAGKKDWAAFAVEFTSKPGEWWLGEPRLKLTAKGAAWLKDLSLKEAAGGPELLWEADTDRPTLGVYNQPDCAMVDAIVEAAERSGVFLELTLLTRDHYMPLLGHEHGAEYDRAIALGRRLVRYAVARWGYSTHVAAWEYFNEMDPGKPTDRFYAELGAAFEAVDVNRHLRSTSTWSSPSKDYRHPRLDTADLHYYLRPSEAAWKDAVAAVQGRWKMMAENVKGRPALFAEFGLADNQWQRAPETDKDTEYLFLHDGLWASALSGFASTASAWWWEDIHKKDMYHLYTPVARFMADVPVTAATLRAAAATADKGLRVLGLQEDGGAYLWLSDPAASWGAVALDGKKPAEVSGAMVTVPGLDPGAYRVEWWDTREGKVVKQEAATAAKEGLALHPPAFTRDIACKVVRGK